MVNQEEAVMKTQTTLAAIISDDICDKKKKRKGALTTNTELGTVQNLGKNHISDWLYFGGKSDII